MLNLEKPRWIKIAAAIALSVVLCAGCASAPVDSGSVKIVDGDTATSEVAIVDEAQGDAAAADEAEDAKVATEFMVSDGEDDIEYGMTEKEVEEVLGKAKASPHMYYYDGGVSVLYSDGSAQALTLGDIEGIFASEGIEMNPAWKTPRGIGVGSTESDLREAYPEATLISDDEDVTSPFITYCAYFKLDDGRWVRDDDPGKAEAMLEKSDKGQISEEDYIAFMYSRLTISFYLDNDTKKVACVSFWSGME